LGAEGKTPCWPEFLDDAVVRDGLADQQKKPALRAAIFVSQAKASQGQCLAGLKPRNPSMSESRVAVEKLLRAKCAKIKLRQDALQTTFSIFLDIFYPPNFRCFEENEVFQHPLRFFTNDPIELRPTPPLSLTGYRGTRGKCYAISGACVRQWRERGASRQMVIS
jgi:hypothetical protein